MFDLLWQAGVEPTQPNLGAPGEEAGNPYAEMDEDFDEEDDDDEDDSFLIDALEMDWVFFHNLHYLH